MLKEQMINIKKYFNNKEENNNKKIENLVVFIIILIVTIIIINTIWNNDKKDDNSLKIQNDDNKKLAKLEDNIVDTSENELEHKLENILKNIEGVGDVKVLLTYSESSKTVAMYNEDSTKNDTEEKDTRRW